MEYFILTDLGYDGISIRKFSDELEARKNYNDALVFMRKDNIGKFPIALISGEILLNNNFDFDTIEL